MRHKQYHMSMGILTRGTVDRCRQEGVTLHMVNPGWNKNQTDLDWIINLVRNSLET